MSDIVAKEQLIQESPIVRDKETVRDRVGDLDRECNICSKKPIRIIEDKSEVEVLLIQGDCACGSASLVRGYFFENTFRLLDNYCPMCGDELDLIRHGEGIPPFKSKEDIRQRVGILDSEIVELSGYWISNEAHRLVEHHTSYTPEETMLVCDSCHGKIHKKSGFRDDLEPDMGRREWEDQKQQQKYHGDD